MRVLKSMLGLHGKQGELADRNMLDFTEKANVAKMKIESISEARKTQTYYFAKGMGVLRRMETAR